MNVNNSFYDDATYTKQGLTLKKAKQIGDMIGVDWSEIDLGEFVQGIKTELEHGNEFGLSDTTNVTNDSMEMTARIALAHLHELPNYYTLLKEMEEKGDQFWETHNRKEWVAEQRKAHQAAWDNALS